MIAPIRKTIPPIPSRVRSTIFSLLFELLITVIGEGGCRELKREQLITNLRKELFHMLLAFTSDRVGGSLTAPVLPHHRTCGSASGGSPRKLKFPQLIQQ